MFGPCWYVSDWVTARLERLLGSEMARRLGKRQTVPASEIGHRMSVTRINAKGRRSTPPFVQFRRDVFLHSEVSCKLSIRAKALILDLTMQYTGRNNGDLIITWKYMKSRNWRSRGTLDSAKQELLDKGMIELTRQGGLGFASLYAVTWWPINECKGKLDVRETTTPRNWWKFGRPPNGDNST